MITVALVRVLLYHYYRPFLYSVFVLLFGVFLSSLIGEMEGKEREREEN